MLEYSFLKEEDAVSPVIGVILMVAITVILAAVIGTFVLGLGQSVQDTAPQVSMSFEAAGNSGEVTATLENGGPLTGSELTMLANGQEVTNASFSDWETGTSQTDDTGFAGEVDVSIRHDPSESIIAEGTVEGVPGY